jgi:hypothetical protein
VATRSAHTTAFGGDSQQVAVNAACARRVNSDAAGTVYPFGDHSFRTGIAERARAVQAHGPWAGAPDPPYPSAPALATKVVPGARPVMVAAAAAGNAPSPVLVTKAARRTAADRSETPRMAAGPSRYPPIR